MFISPVWLIEIKTGKWLYSRFTCLRHRLTAKSKKPPHPTYQKGKENSINLAYLSVLYTIGIKGNARLKLCLSFNCYIMVHMGCDIHLEEAWIYNIWSLIFQLQIQHHLKLFPHFIFLIEFVLLYSLGFRLSNIKVNGKWNKMNHEFVKSRLH